MLHRIGRGEGVVMRLLRPARPASERNTPLLLLAPAVAGFLAPSSPLRSTFAKFG